MNSTIIWLGIVMLILLTVAFIVTIRIGNSSANKEGNPDYDKKTKNYWKGLSIYYLLGTIITVVIVLYFIY